MRMTRKRKISLAVHIAFVSIPLVAGALAAVAMWYALFGSLWFAIPMVVVVEVLALAGLVLYIARIPSPFWTLRHLLPFISIVPLAYELYLLLAKNGFATAITATTVVASILIWVAHKCYRTIEDLFIDPAQAAEELAREQVEKTSLMLHGLQAQMRLVQQHAEDYRQTIRVLAAPQLALPEPSGMIDIADVDGGELDEAPAQPKRTMSDLVREYRERGLSVNAIMSLHPNWNKRSVQTIYNNR